MFRFVFVSLLSFLVIGCSSPGKKSSREASFQLRPFSEVTLNNGLQVFFFHDDSLPRVSFQLLLKTGGNVDPEKKSGLGAILAEMVGVSTKKYTAEELSEMYGQLGTSFGSATSIEYTSHSTSGLSLYKNELLELFAHTILEPKFEKTEIERVKSRALAAIARRSDSPGAFASQLLSHKVHGNGYYGIPQGGLKKDVEALRRRDILRQYLRYYRPNNALLAVVGNFDKGFETAVSTRFSDWGQREVAAVPVAPAAQLTGKVYLVDKPDLQQTEIRVGGLGVARGDEDFLLARAANTVLGGAFVSRLNTRIRDELGLSYGASSFYRDGRYPRELVIATSTKHESVGQVLREIDQIVKKFTAQGVSAEELEAAKALMKGNFPQAIETADKLAFNVLMTRVWGVSDDYLKYYIDNVDEIELADVNRFIKESLKPDQHVTVLYTSGDKIKEQLSQEVETISYDKTSL